MFIAFHYSPLQQLLTGIPAVAHINRSLGLKVCGVKLLCDLFISSFGNGFYQLRQLGSNPNPEPESVLVWGFWAFDVEGP